MNRRDLIQTAVAGALTASPAARAMVGLLGGAVAAQGATFDYYISTTGSDTNPGTLASPWAITSLTRTSANRSSMAGKRIGLLPGTYGIYSLWNSGSYGYQTPCLALPAGTSGSRTFVGASDSSGYQTIGSNPSNITHAITASPSGTPGGGLPGTYSGGFSTASIAMIGFDYRDYLGGGYVQIDGIAISDSTNLIVSFYGQATNTSQSGAIMDCWLTNCLIYNCSGNEGNNTGAVWFGGGAGSGGVQNCIIHDCQIPWPPTAGSGTLHNCAGIFSEASLYNLYEHNTIYNCNCGIYDKNQGNGGNTYRYNYLEVNGNYPQNVMLDCAGGPSGSTAIVHHNILVIAPATGSERFFWQGICTDGPGANPTQAMQFYNNTCYVLSSGGVQGAVTYQSPGSGSVTHYNNIYVSAAPGFYDTISFNSGAGVIAISDYNAYIGGCGGGSYFGLGTNGAPANNYTVNNSGTGTWQTGFSLDTHSFVQASENGVFTSPGGAQSPAGYQLASGSPCIGTGSTTGTTGGSACDMGAFGGASPPSRIGSSLS